MSSPSSSGAQPIVVRAEPIELCQFLKFCGASSTGGAAKQEIAAGQVEVNGELELRKRRKLVAGDLVSLGGKTYRVVLA